MLLKDNPVKTPPGVRSLHNIEGDCRIVTWGASPLKGQWVWSFWPQKVLVGLWSAWRPDVQVQIDGLGLDGFVGCSSSAKTPVIRQWKIKTKATPRSRFPTITCFNSRTVKLSRPIGVSRDLTGLGPAEYSLKRCSRAVLQVRILSIKTFGKKHVY